MRRPGLKGFDSKASCSNDLDAQWHREPFAECFCTFAHLEQSVPVLGQKCLILVRWRRVVGSARRTSEDHNATSSPVAVEVKGDLGPLGDMV
jgi:hypothetical protein